MNLIIVWEVVTCMDKITNNITLLRQIVEKQEQFSKEIISARWPGFKGYEVDSTQIGIGGP